MDANELANRVAHEMLAGEGAGPAWGIRIEEARADYARISMVVRADMLNSHGIAHGGMIFALADTAFAYVCNGANHASVGAQASIVFDINAPLATNTFTSTIGAAPPTSSVTTLPATSWATSGKFTVSWAGQDDPGEVGVRPAGAGEQAAGEVDHRVAGRRLLEVRGRLDVRADAGEQQRRQQAGRHAPGQADGHVAQGVGIRGRAGRDRPLLDREHVGELRPLQVEVLQPVVAALVLRLQEADLGHPGGVGSAGPLGRRHLLQRQAQLVALLLHLGPELRELGAENVAAFFCEPIMGSGGVIVPPQGWLKAISNACRDLGILFVVQDVPANG